MAKKKILVIEDDRDISELINYNLDREGYDVSCLYEGVSAVDYVRKRLPDLVLLDLMLPEVDGIEICRLLKSNDVTKKIPIIMLTAKSEESDVVVGLQMGADDYISKPFSPKVLLARVKALLRRVGDSANATGEENLRQYGDLTIDLLKHKVYFLKQSIELTSIEFDILEFLSRHPGRVYDREQILDNVWKEGKFIVDRAVDVHIRGLRKKLDKADNYIETVRGVGYRFKDNE